MKGTGNLKLRRLRPLLAITTALLSFNCAWGLSLSGCSAGTTDVVSYRSSCEVCHAPRDETGAIGGIEQAHRGVDISCTDCHGGAAWLCDGVQGGSEQEPTCDGEWIYDKQLAHVSPSGGPKYLKNLSSQELDNVDPDYLRFINPGDLRVLEQTCAPCHSEAAELLPRSTMAHTSGEITVARYRSNAQATPTALFGALELRDPDFAEADSCASQRLELFEPPAYEYEDSFLESGMDVADAQDQYLVKSCLRCHLGDFGENRFVGDFRSSGCSACHMLYNDDGLSKSADPRINKQTAPHPETHQFVAAPPVSQCTHCHYRGGRIGPSFQGYRESAGPGQNPENPEPLDTTLHGDDPNLFLVDEDNTNDFDETPPDVHFEAGMHCVDCHLTDEVHGNGHLYADTECAVTTQCEDCHGSARRRAQLDPARPALTERDGDFYLRTKVTDLELRVPQVLDAVTPGNPRYLPLAELAMGVSDSGHSHTDDLECYTCHAAWIPSCYGCHVQVDFSRSERYQSSGIVLPGAPSVTRRWVQLNDLVLMRDTNGKLAPSMPSERLFMTVVGVEGTDEQGEALSTPTREKPRKFTFEDGRSIAAFGQRAFDPHTTRRLSQFMACDRCHSVGTADNPDNAVLLDITYGFGSERFLQSACDVLNDDQSCDPDTDFTTYPLDALMTREGKPLVVVGHPLPNESRPLNLIEIEGMRRILVPDDAPFSTEIPEDALRNPTWPHAQQLE